jgi:hypothetical protein
LGSVDDESSVGCGGQATIRFGVRESCRDLRGISDAEAKIKEEFQEHQ